MIVAGGLVRQGLLRAADRPLLHDLAGGTLTGRQLLDNVDRLAGALCARQLTGARIGLCYRNSLAALEAFLAVEWIGGTRLAVDPNAPEGEARAIFAAADVEAVLTDAARATGLGPSALVHDDDQRLAEAATWPAVEVDANKTALIYPRAVEAGRLFGVPLSYANWTATVETNAALYRAGAYGAWNEERECFLNAQQIMHGTGFLGTFPFLAMGLPQVLAADFDIDAIGDALARHAVTSTMLVPVMLRRMTEAAEATPHKFATLRHVLYGGGPVTRDDLRRAIGALGPVLSQVYGRFEGGWPITILDPQDHAAIVAGDDARGRSCGRAIGQVEMRLRPQPGSGATSSELCVRSPMVSADYADADGWCSLGDLMTIDDDGYFSFEGRLDRMINTGYHIYPAEVEAAIAQVGAVKSVRVVGEANPQWGATVVAYLVLEGDVPSDSVVAHIKAELTGQLAKYKIPRIFRVVDELPESA